MSRTQERFQKVISNFDWTLTSLIVLICAAGILVLLSAGYNSETETSPQVRRQVIAMLVGFAIYLIVMFFPSNFWRRWSPVFFIFTTLSLIAVLFIGDTAGGAQRWLDLGFIRFQPSEVSKVTLILILARIFSSERAPRTGYSLKTLWYPCLIALIPILLIRQQPDLGTALCHLLIAGTMLLMFGVRAKTLLVLGLLCVVAAVPAWFMLKDYQRDRITSFLSPEHDPQGSGYHGRQSRIAVGSGAMFGKGFRQGTQTQLRFLPEQTTDFIFSVLAEEWGFVGSSIVIALYFLLLTHCFNIARRCSDKFSAFVAIGVAAFIFWHVMINISMVVGMMPVVGLTLPLLSYGGTSVVSVLFALGLVAGVQIRRFLFS